MASQEYSFVEQDHNVLKDGDELPTYDDLAAQSGPNSRFGRWRGWIEKRAAERYGDISPQERDRRRERGWGNDDPDLVGSTKVPIIVNEPATPMPTNLYIQTNVNAFTSQASIPPEPSLPLPPLPAVSLKLDPTHLRIHQFGSRFLPHTTSPIRCLLPLLSDRLMLIGHDEGLSVLDMFPQEWSESGAGITIKGPDEARARLIWRGESVYQMSILEVEEGEGSPQGVVLLLVGPEPDSPSAKDSESPRALRMYNLASLTSLAKWAVAQKGARPLDLHRPNNWNAQQTPTKRHRPQGSIARSLRGLMESPSSNNNGPPEPSSSSYRGLLSPSPSVTSTAYSMNTNTRSATPNPTRQDSDEWDIIDDLPLRWATDFVPLAAPGSRLTNSSVLSYAIWTGNDQAIGRGGRLLAVATKTNILLYETPKGERAFRFVKEFYTPLTPRSVTFFQQTVHDVTRSPSDVGPRNHLNHQPHRRTDSTATVRPVSSHAPTTSVGIDYGTQLSLFVIFDKKAGWIRIADSAVGEMALCDTGTSSSPHAWDPTSTGGSTNSRKSRMSMIADVQHGLGRWIPPIQCELPIPPMALGFSATKRVFLMTRGKQTHILPAPLPVSSSPCPPLHVVNWKNAPGSITPRVCDPTTDLDGNIIQPYMQLVSLGEHGVEVQEITLNFLSKGKGKGKARAETTIRAEEDTGGDTGILCTGGHWDRPHYTPYGGSLSRSYSTASDISASSYGSMSTEEIVTKMRKTEGIYGWCRKGLEDWRVFWLGGSLSDDYEE